jgi:hypothetical protein
MDSYSKYRELAVRIKCIDSKGSGCLFQPDTTEYSYVITAKHCLEGNDDDPQQFIEDDIEIYRNVNGERTQLKVLKFYLHNTHDLAVIKVEFIDGLIGTLTTTPKDGKSVGIYGFPHLLDVTSDTAELGHCLKCTVNFIYPDKNIIEFTPNSNISNYKDSVNSTLVGFSGSGIFLETNEDLYLVGIFTQLKEENGGFEGLWGYDVSSINKVLYDNQLPLLIPKELLNFKIYIDSAFESNEGFIPPILKLNARSILDLKPIDIVNIHNERLYLPYNTFVEEELLNPKLWEGWASLLTYYYMDTSTLPNKADFKLVRSNEDNQHNIRMYFTNHKKLSKSIKHLYSKSYDDLYRDDVIVINTKDGVPGTKSYNKEKTKKVLRQIDHGEKEKLMEKGIEIDNPDYSKDIQFIHIDLFKDKFSDHDEVEQRAELEDRLKGSIKEVFNNVP